MGLRTEPAFASTITKVVDRLQDERGSELYRKLWQVCAGPHVYIPREGEKVFYFPQGHMEQVEKYTNKEGKVEMPIYDLPPHILCRVVSVQLKAESNTDEVFAQITLLPEANQYDLSSKKENPKHQQRSYQHFFSKKLTPSDTSTHGGFSIPRRYAEKCLPLLDMSQDPPMQELVAKDLHGTDWRFRHIYRGQPRRHLLTSGWSMFAASKKLVTGDAFILLRGQNGELHVGIRRAQFQNNASNSLISGHNMQHGILATANHAVCTGSMFTVYYRPWASHEFIIPLDWYKSLEEIYHYVGARFRMSCGSEESTEKRDLGTIVGIGDIDHVRWPNSEWGCLKVKWDNISDATLHSDQICPWNIKLIESTNDKNLRFIRHQKRTPADEASVHGFVKLPKKGLVRQAVNCAPQSPPRVLQGQEFSNTGVNQFSEHTSQLFPYVVHPQNPIFNQTKSQTKKHAPLPVCEKVHQYPISIASFSGGNAAVSGMALQHVAALSRGSNEEALASRKLPIQTVDSYGVLPREWITLKLRSENEAAIAKPNESRCRSIESDTIQVSDPAKSSSDIYAKSQV